MTIGSVVFRVHAVQRMFERNISVINIQKALENEEVIEDYSSEMPEPGMLILGYKGSRSFHVVVSKNANTNDVTVITVYIPDPHKWKRDDRTRES